MDPIKGAGTVDYAMTVPQNQNQVQGGYEDYSTMPMVYDEATEAKRESASSGKGLMALGALAIAGLALWGGHRWAAKDLKAAKEAVTEAEKVAKEAVDKAEALKKCNDDAYKIVEENKIIWRKRGELKKALKPEGEVKAEVKPKVEAKPEVKPETKPEVEVPKED